jgi:hypothetical protein
MAVDDAARRHRGAGVAHRRPRNNAEVEGVQRSACARAGEPRDDDARLPGASSREGLQQAVAGVNAMADGGPLFLFLLGDATNGLSSTLPCCS